MKMCFRFHTFLLMCFLWATSLLGDVGDIKEGEGKKV